MALTFGVTVLPDPPYQRLIELIQMAERHGFEYGWTYDSHVLWQESTPTLALAAAATERIKLGHMVTNPGTREPTVVASMYATLHDISNGRMVMGVGRGDSARRYINQKPVRVGPFEDALRMIKPFMNGEKVDWNDTELELTWVRDDLPPILTIQGDADAVVPYQHGVMLHDALARTNTKNLFLTIPGGGHGRFTANERAMIYEVINTFLEQHGLE